MKQVKPTKKERCSEKEEIEGSEQRKEKEEA
jgi:hypothetical protein